MPKDFTFYFRGTDIKKLSNLIDTQNGGYFLASFVIDDSTGAISAQIDAFHHDDLGSTTIPITHLGNAVGCPVPPCIPTNGFTSLNTKLVIEPTCIKEVEKRIKKIEKNNKLK